MKKILFGVFALVLLSSSGFVRAATCTPPTPPVCYQNIPIYPNGGFQSDGAIVSADGQQVVLPNGNVVQNSQRVQVDCTDDPLYQEQMLSYNTCLQMANPSYDTSGNQVVCFAPIASGCTTESSYNAMQIQQNINGMAGDPGSVSALAACRSQINDYQAKSAAYSACLSSQQTQSKPSSDRQLSPSDTSRLDCTKLGIWFTYDEATHTCVDNKETKFTNICQSIWGTNSHSDSSTDECRCNDGYTEGYNSKGIFACVPLQSTATTSSQTSCPLYATANANGGCTCDTGFVRGFGGDANKCITRNQAMTESCSKLYGPETHYNLSLDKCECTAGYVFENGSDAQNNRCVVQGSVNAPQKQNIDASNEATSTASSTSYEQTRATEILAIEESAQTPPPQKHWYEWLNPINWFAWFYK